MLKTGALATDVIGKKSWTVIPDREALLPALCCSLRRVGHIMMGLHLAGPQQKASTGHPPLMSAPVFLAVPWVKRCSDVIWMGS